MLSSNIYSLLESKDPFLAFQLVNFSCEDKGSPRALSEIVIHEDTQVLYLTNQLHPSHSLKLLTWLNSDREHFLIILETKLEVIHTLFSEDASSLEDVKVIDILGHARCFIHHFDKSQQDKLLFQYAWMGVFLKSQVIGCMELDPLKDQELKGSLKRYEDEAYCNVSDWSDFGLRVTQNLYQHALSLKEFKEAKNLKGAFPKIPALVFGAGASLKEALKKIKGYENKALFLAGGSALSFLPQEGIKAHLGAYIDPNPCPVTFEKGLDDSLAMLISFRLKHAIAEQIQGDKLYFHDNSGYLLEDEIYKKLSLESSKDTWGWNVGTTLVKWALEMGCDPVIMVGMDMAYEQEEALLANEEEVMTHQGIKISRKDFIMGAYFLEELKEQYPHQTILHATSEGILLKGIKSIALDEALELLHLDYGCIERMKNAIQSITLKEVCQETVKERLDQFYLSMVKTSSIMDSMLKLAEKHYSKTQSFIDHIALEEVELEAEEAYQFILEPLWERFQWPLLRHRCYRPYTQSEMMIKILFMKQAIKVHLEVLKEELGKYEKISV